MSDAEGISRRKRLLLLSIEAMLVLVVLILLLSTYLPAIIGGNPERQ